MFYLIIQEFSIFERLRPYLSEIDIFAISKIYPQLVQVNSLDLLFELNENVRLKNNQALHKILPFVPKDITQTFLGIVVQDVNITLKTFATFIKHCSLTTENQQELLINILQNTSLSKLFVSRFEIIVENYQMPSEKVQDFFIHYNLKNCRKWEKWENLSKLCDFVYNLRKGQIKFEKMSNLIPDNQSISGYSSFYKHKYDLLVFGESLPRINEIEHKFQQNMRSCSIC